jgi:hypothetical protein
VVAVSYLVMLGYIALALAALPPPSQLLHVFVLSRAGALRGWVEGGARARVCLRGCRSCAL